MAANVWQKAQKFAGTALDLLRREVKLPGLFTWKFTKADFTGAAGDTVMVKRPPVLVARDKGWRNQDAIVVDRLVQTKIPVVLDQHPYSAVAIGAEERTLDEVDYVRDVQKPQVDAMVDYFERAIVKPLRGADFTMEVAYDPEGTGRVADARKVALRARKLFQDAHVPTSGRYWLVGSSVAESISSTDQLLEVDKAGIPEALRDGVVGRLAGFTIIEVDALGEDESYFVHSSALAIAVVAPTPPISNVKSGAVAAGNGLAVTQIWDYDGDHLTDRSVVHAFVGASLVTDPEVNEDGSLVLGNNDEPQLEFRRAIKVQYGAAEAAAAADAGAASTYTLAVTGSPTGGTYTLEVDGTETEELPHNATNAVIASALNGVEGVSGAQVSGTSPKTLTFSEGVTVEVGTVSFEGGTDPNVTVTAA
ncbi:hypothetical protein GCM10011490_24180 [Pseudoclavibacter endophyticus]|uniref:Major capsid protein n=1 Tax=Pseudoclavibacter endophyticus TaxID=1778590 RepID=A0A6H9WCK5_9MICO|nr:phage capsid protein [Pseudoclavibacter endophyticus]KAB1648420.1 hypothetical protein F8O04_12100 [Pseudoclavibacter endophyticus]GGA72569.1 hypothetical protein GCM10011490_24180 [Pseudoclavibacter endophyticus]